MSAIRNGLGGIVLLAAAILSPAVAFAQDATVDETLKAFRQLDGAEKMQKPNAFTAPGDPLSPATTAKTIHFAAKLTDAGKPVEDGLIWSVFSPAPGTDEKLPLVASATGGSADFQLPPGDYFVNVAFGRAGVTKRLKVPLVGKVDDQVLVLDAGGMVLNAVSGADMRIPSDDLSFTIYSSETKEDGERGLVMDDVQPNQVVRLNAGTYHIVSEYGDVNAVIRADIQVEAGKLTKAVIQHRAAQVTLKLVSEQGGEALADTAWSVLTTSGDTLSESVSPFPTLVLAEGQYTAVARNKDKIFQKDFEVKAGVNTDIEVLTTDVARKQDPTTAFVAD